MNKSFNVNEITQELVNRLKRDATLAQKIKENPKLYFDMVDSTMFDGVEIEIVEQSDSLVHFVIPYINENITHEDLVLIRAGVKSGSLGCVSSGSSAACIYTFSSVGSIDGAGTLLCLSTLTSAATVLGTASTVKLVLEK